MTIGLAYAMTDEIKGLLARAGAKLLETAAGMAVYQIEPGILAYIGGVGKVNAAMSAQLFIDRFRPDWILNAGVAGSFLDLPIGTVVLADCFIQHDVDTTAAGDPAGFVSTVGRVDCPTDGVEPLSRCLTGLGIPFLRGKVATGEVFMTRGKRADWVAETFAPTLCEMEGGAIAQVCLRNGVPFSALKSVSDRLCQADNVSEYFNFGEAMDKLNAVVLPAARCLRDSAFSGGAQEES